MTDLHAGIAEKLENYRQTRHIEVGSLAWRELLAGYRHTDPTVFAELLDRELARLRGGQRESLQNDTNGRTPQ